MENKIELYQIASTGRVKHLVIENTGNVLKSSWWTSLEGIDGEKQSTSDTISGVNAGRSNETSDEEQCFLEWERKIVTKKEQGYVETLEEALAKSKESLDVTQQLPKEFAPSKPISKMAGKADPFDGTWYAERKYNGECVVLHNTGLEQFIYSRTNHVITDIARSVEDLDYKLSLVPSGTLVLGELIAYEKDGTENTKYLKGVTHYKTTPQKARARYNELKEAGIRFVFHPYEVYFFQGEDVTTKPFWERDELIEGMFGVDRDIKLFTEDMVQTALDKGWEGYILRQQDSTIKYTMNGKPKRAGGYKFKFIFETDCFITGVKPGTGKNQQRLAKLTLAQYDGSGNIVQAKGSGTGKFTDEEVDEFTQKILSMGYEFGEINLNPSDWIPVEIQYQSRQPKNSKGEFGFEFPQPIRLREDKTPEECLFEEFNLVM